MSRKQKKLYGSQYKVTLNGGVVKLGYRSEFHYSLFEFKNWARAEIKKHYQKQGYTQIGVSFYNQQSLREIEKL